MQIEQHGFTERPRHIPTELFMTDDAKWSKWLVNLSWRSGYLQCANGGQERHPAGRLGPEGVPDLFVPAWRLWVEMKYQRWQPQPGAERLDHILGKNGILCIVGKGRGRKNKITEAAKP